MENNEIYQLTSPREDDKLTREDVDRCTAFLMNVLLPMSKAGIIDGYDIDFSNLSYYRKMKIDVRLTNGESMNYSTDTNSFNADERQAFYDFAKRLVNIRQDILGSLKRQISILEAE